MRSKLDLSPQLLPLFWGLLLTEATFGAYLSIWPLWIEELGAPIATVGLVLGAGGFLRLFVLAPSARIAERFGYRNTILVARFIASLGFLSAAFATHWTQLLIMVVAASIGEMVFPLIQSLVATEAGEQKIRAFALIFNVGPSIALMISPLISAALVATFGMRAGFLLAAFFSASSMLILRNIHEPTVTEHPSGVKIDSSFSATIANPSVRLVGGLLVITVFSLSLGIAFIPTFLEDVRGFSPASIAALGSLAAVGSAIFGLSVARIRRLQRAPYLTTTIAIGMMVIALVIFRTTAIVPLVALAFFCRGGFFSAWAMLVGILGEASPEAIRSRAFALLEMAGGVAFSLGPIVAGVLYARNATLPLVVGAVLATCLIPIFWVVQRRVQRSTRAKASSAEAAI